ncbi:hypothetical protein SLS56_007391 [Neofusicoccum ribis]|uniref:Uncharacterized protein n=1 Tax=Neofusicoccum ribis TaxID=45134 RepID=A0ABR3SN04_9PEZI
MPPKRSTRATQPSQTTTTATTTRTTRAAAPTAPAAKPSRGSSTKPPTAAPDPIEDGDTDDSDALLISTRPGRISSMAARRAREPRAEEVDYTMTGGLGVGAGGGRNARTRGRVVPKKVVRRDEGQARALEALRRRREEAEGRGGDAVEEGEGEDDGEEETRGRQQRAAVPSSSPAVPATASRVRRASSSHWHNAPPSAVKAQGTPAADTSVLALSKFRRRPRQPSLLRMMQQSDVENEEDGGSADESGLTLDYSLGDFEPDHESTPLNLRKGGVEGAALGSEPRTASSRKRKLAERGREEVQVPRSSPPVIGEQEVAPPPRETSSERLYSEASELPPLGVADTQPEPVDEPVLSDTMAPPRSTSPLSSIQVREETPPPAKRPRRAAARNAANDEEDHAADPLSSSDGDSASATETAVRSRNARKKTDKRKPKAMSLSTATLQSLLPRRRKKAATRHAKQTAAEAFEIPSSDVEEEEEEASASDDEDELHRAPAAARRRKKGRAAKAAVVVGGGGDKKKRLSRTYGRRSSDKENQDGDVDASMYVRSGGESDGDEEVLETSEMRDVRRSRELEAAAKKFAEVDEWEMEFESVDLGGASASSPWR